MTMPLALHEAVQHGIHAALPAATAALEKLQCVGVKAHGHLTLILGRSAHQPSRRTGAAYPIGGNPVPNGIARHVRREFLFSLAGNRGPIGPVFARASIAASSSAEYLTILPLFRISRAPH